MSKKLKVELKKFFIVKQRLQYNINQIYGFLYQCAQFYYPPL